jgi:hypothetical protein
MTAVAAALLAAAPALGQAVIPTPEANEAPGARPYEMVWAHREEPAQPSLRFDQLAGWTMQAQGGVEASLQVTRAQNVWDRPVARLRYRGRGGSEATPRLLITLPQSLAVPEDADAVELWVYGNRWDWENPPGTPPVRLALRLRDGSGQPVSLQLGHVRWQEWWLIHKRLPAGLRGPLRFEALEVAGGSQPDWRDLFFDSVRFYREDLAPLTFPPRPKRNLKLPDGQSPGINTGPATLPFPVREETILPAHRSGAYHTGVSAAADAFHLEYRGEDGVLTYRFDPAKGLSGLSAAWNGQAVGALFDGAQVKLAGGGTNWVPRDARLKGGTITADYENGATLELRLWQKSLVVDVTQRTGQAVDLAFGQLANLVEPRTVWVPYLTYGNGPHPSVLLSKAGGAHVFTSIWLDWYRSNGSEPYAAETVVSNTARINGGVRYQARTDGLRNPLFERLFVTVSPQFEEVLPVVPNPPGLHAAAAVDRLWQESWGPDDYEKQMQRSRRLRAYGIEKLIQCNHEITWRDGGESFTLRLRAAPKRGGDSALARYVLHQRGQGWLAGLYSNYTDYAPVNEHWTPDAVQRQPDGNWRTAWPRCYALKPVKAVEFDALLAPRIKFRFSPTSAYTDVHTAVAPWGYNDYDARVPGAGTFAQTFYAYGELLRNDSRVYESPIFSEGSYHWLYAGLADGNYALAYDGRPLAREPLLPVFDLLQIHPKECDIGMGWTANFCDALPDWRAPQNIDRAIDRFLLHTLAYGHIGWLVEEEHGMGRVGRSYYMLQQVQARYGLKAPERIAYYDGTRLCDVSTAIVRDLPRTRRQLYVAYPGGLELWLNDHPTDTWKLFGVPFDAPTAAAQGASAARARSELLVPPAGWAALAPGGELVSYSALEGTNRVDYLRSRAYTYQDGRGHWFATAEAAANGALAITRPAPNQLRVIRISGEGDFLIRRPYGVRGPLAQCEVFDADGQRLAPPATTDTGQETRVEPVEKGVRYELRFGRSGR